MTQTQKEAALTLFRNVEHKAKLLMDAADSGECDDVEIDNDLAGDMIHAERCVNALYDVFVERKRRGQVMGRLVLVKSWGGDSAYGPECYKWLTEEQWKEVKRLQVEIGLWADAVRDSVDTRDAGGLAHDLETLEKLIRRIKAEMSNG